MYTCITVYSSNAVKYFYLTKILCPPGMDICISGTDAIK